MITLASLIKVERLARGLTLDDLSARTGMAASNLSRLESGRIDPRESTLRTVLAAMDLTLAVIPTRRLTLDEVRERMADGAGRLGESDIGERDNEARLAWKEARGLDTSVERRILGLSDAGR